MKKLTMVLGIVLVLGSLLFVNARVSALTLIESSDSLLVAAASIPERVATLERQVADLFNQIAHIQLIPGPQGPAGPQGPQGPTGTSLHLYDANGQDLGILLGMPPSDLANYKYQTYLPNAKISLRLTQNLEFEDGNSTIYFLTADCSGTPYSLGSPFYPYGFVRNGSHFYRSTNAQSSQISFLSRYDGGGCIVSGGSTNSVKVEEIPAPFTLPLAWPPEIRVN